MAYLNPTPGVANAQVVVELDFQANATITTGSVVLSAGKISIPAIQKLTVNTSNGTYEWAQLDSRAKKVVATVSTNSLVTDVVVDRTTFFGDSAATAGSLAKAGILSAQSNKSYLAFKVRMDSPTGDGQGDTISGVGYITQLAPTIAAEQPVWSTPLTLVVDGEFVIKTGDTL
jgi:hypothetical protein